jgi:hypothetical protein
MRASRHFYNACEVSMNTIESNKIRICWEQDEHSSAACGITFEPGGTSHGLSDADLESA